MMLNAPMSSCVLSEVNHEGGALKNYTTNRKKNHGSRAEVCVALSGSPPLYGPSASFSNAESTKHLAGLDLHLSTLPV